MIELRTGNKKLYKFSNIDINLLLDTVASTFKFETYMDIENKSNIELFKPFSYKPASVYYIDQNTGESQKLITGIILNQGLSVSKKPKLTAISGYSKTGVLEDCTIPTDLYPLQTEGVGLDVIASNICKYFGLQLVIFDNAKVDAAKPFERTNANPSEKIKSFLSNLAISRNITIAHDNLGRLLLYKVEAKIKPAARLNENDQSLNILMTPNSQGVHSDITVIKQVSPENEDLTARAKVISPFCPKGVKRPLVQIMQFGDGNDVKKLAESIAAKEAKNFVITIEKEGWLIGGRLLRSGFYIELEAPSIFLERTKLIIQSINYKQNKQNGETVTIKAVLPCVYTGILPSKSPFK